MAKGKGSIQGWITKNGVHIPIYGNYTVREGHEPTAKGAKFKGGKKKKVDTSTTLGKTTKQLEDNLKKKGLVLESADKADMAHKDFNDEKVTLYDNDGNVYRGTYNRYQNGDKEIVNIERDRSAEKVQAGQVEGKDVKSKKAEAGQEKDKYANRDWNKDVDDAKRYGYSEQSETGKKPVTKAEESSSKYDKVSPGGASEWSGITDRGVMEAVQNGNKAGIEEMSRRGLSTLRDYQNFKNEQKSSKAYTDDEKQDIYDRYVKHEKAAGNSGPMYSPKAYDDSTYDLWNTYLDKGQKSSTPDFSKMSYSEAGKYVAANKARYGLKDSDDAYLAAYQMKKGEWKGASTVQENRRWANDMNEKTMVDGPKSSTSKISTKAQKIADNARKSLMFDKGYAEISPNHWSWAGMSNDKVVAALNASDPKYSYEMRTESEKGGAMLNNGTINHTRLYRTEKSQGSATAKKDTTNMMTKAKAAAGGNKPMKNPKTTSLMTKKKAEARATSFNSMTVSGLKQAFTNASADEKAKISAELRRKGYSLVGGKWVKGSKS